MSGGIDMRWGIALFFAVLAAPATAADVAVETGRRIFHEGRNARGEPVRALLAQSTLALSGAAVACGNCHGADGRGRPEGGVQPSDIRWDELTKPYGHSHGNGRRHGPFDLRSFARAMTEGLDPDGGRIDVAMPRYSLSASEVESLVAYLARLADERDPGITDTTLRLGTILPDTGPPAELGGALRAMLRAYVGDLNERGGVHGRRLELVIAGNLAQAEQRFRDRPVFALVSPYAVGNEKALLDFASAQGLAVVAPFTMTVLPDSPLHAFYLYPGAADLARVLFDFAWRGSGGLQQRWAAFVDRPGGAIEAALRDECARRGCAGLEVLPSALADNPGAVARLRHSGVQNLVFAGSEAELTALLGLADRMSWHPNVYAPVSVAAKAMLAAPAQFAGRLFAAYPVRAEPQRNSAAAETFERLRRSHGLGQAHAMATGFAYASMSIAVEGLRRAGRELSRESFVRAVEGLHRFDAGPTPPVSFGPGRRVGALGGFVVSVDPRHGFRPVSDWIGVEGR